MRLLNIMRMFRHAHECALTATFRSTSSVVVKAVRQGVCVTPERLSQKQKRRKGSTPERGIIVRIIHRSKKYATNAARQNGVTLDGVTLKSCIARVRQNRQQPDIMVGHTEKYDKTDSMPEWQVVPTNMSKQVL